MVGGPQPAAAAAPPPPRRAWRRLRPLLLGLACGLLLAAAAVQFWPAPAGWGQLGPATHLTSIGADVFFVNLPQIVRRGPPRVVVVRLEQPATLQPYHYAAQGLGGPQTIEDWATQLQAPLVFNAGQFDDRLQHLGWLKGGGSWLQRQRKAAWMGLLVSGPAAGERWSRVVDLEGADPALAERFDNIVQSMMLVDEAARVRVRRSELAACRTVVAEDGHGRLLIIATEGAVTLHELASWLPRSGLGIVRAMNLDGGVESQLALSTPELSLTLYGQYGSGGGPFEVRQMVRYPLPAVVALRRR